MSSTAFNPLMIRSKLLVRLSLVIMTPLGCEVDPDVYCKNAMSHIDDDGGGGSDDGGDDDDDGGGSDDDGDDDDDDGDDGDDGDVSHCLYCS